MPTYEYRCGKCEHRFERFLSISVASREDQLCPKCSTVAHRMISGGGGLIFRGSGFYCTDYGRKKPKKEGKDG